MYSNCTVQTPDSSTKHGYSGGLKTVERLKVPSMFHLTRQKSKSFSDVLDDKSRKKNSTGPYLSAGLGSSLNGSATSVSSAEHSRVSSRTSSPLLSPNRRFAGLKKTFPKRKHRANGKDVSENEESDVKVLYVPPERPKQFLKVLAQIRERAMQSSGARWRSKTFDHTGTDFSRKSLISTGSVTEGAPRRRSVSMLTDEENLDSDCLEGTASSQEKEDEVDGATVDYENQRCRIEQKMERTKKRLKKLQEERDEFVKEYLESAEGTHTNKAVRVNFEKRNQKTNAAINQLQKKLEKYHKALQDPEKGSREGNSSGRMAKEVFKGVKENIRGISGGVRDGVIGAVTKPLEIANLIKNRKFGSAENVGTITGSSPGTRTDGLEEEPSSPGALSEDPDRFVKTEIDRSHGSSNLSPRYSDEDSSSIASGTHVSLPPVSAGSPRHSLPPSPPTYNQYESEITDVKETQSRIQTNMEGYKHQIDYLDRLLQEERYKSENLQCQLNDLTSQWNDMTELHQNEMLSLKQELERAEERIELVEYRSAERAGEIEEALDTHVTRILKMEALQQQNQQMVGGFESYVDENMKAKMLLSKLLTVVIAMLQILLILFTTAARIILPFTRTRCRLLLTSLVVVSFAVLWKYQEHENVLAVTNNIREHFMVFRDRVVSMTTPIRDFFNRKHWSKFNS